MNRIFRMKSSKYDRHCLKIGPGDVDVCCVSVGDICSCECDGCLAARRLDLIRSLKGIIENVKKSMEQELGFIDFDEDAK